MSLKFKENKLVLASHNQGKLAEIKALLADCALTILSAQDFKLQEPLETGKTFAENALLKAHYVHQQTGLPALADDSGLCVNALGGKPGIYSARWAGVKKDFNQAMHKVNEKLIALKTNDRSAYFICVLALVVKEQESLIFEGQIKGNLIWPPRGGNGFGFDPMFIPCGYHQTFGELASAIKQEISHRSQALQKFKHYLKSC